MIALLPRISDEKVAWSASVNYQQRLIGTSTFTPRLQVAGDWVRRDTAGASVLSLTDEQNPLGLEFVENQPELLLNDLQDPTVDLAIINGMVSGVTGAAERLASAADR